MNFPIRDNLGEIDPVQRQNHLNTSVTPEEFVRHSNNKTLEQLQFEGGSSQKVLFEGNDNPELFGNFTTSGFVNFQEIKSF